MLKREESLPRSTRLDQLAAQLKSALRLTFAAPLRLGLYELVDGVVILQLRVLETHSLCADMKRSLHDAGAVSMVQQTIQRRDSVGDLKTLYKGCTLNI